MRLSCSVALTLLAACGARQASSVPPDGGSDSGAAERGDAGEDAGAQDSGAFDAGAPDGGSSDHYACVVVQIRNGGCAEAQPPGSLDGVTAGTPFTLTYDGLTASVPGSFSCTGTLSDGGFSCLINGCPFSAQCPADSGLCPNVTWVVWASDPVTGRPPPLDAGDLYVGIPFNNGFNAHCYPAP